MCVCVPPAAFARGPRSAEGHDSEVLRGAEATLNRTSVVEFEYHRVGLWKERPLFPTVSRLEALGFRCYWQSSTGRLARAAADECLAALTEHFMSNLVCARAADIWRVLDSLCS
jgi:hypothetical protein